MEGYSLSDAAKNVYDKFESNVSDIKTELDNAYTRSQSFSSVDITINNGKKASDFVANISQAIDHRFQIDMDVASDSSTRAATFDITSSRITGEISIPGVKSENVTFNIASELSGTVTSDEEKGKVTFDIDGYNMGNIIIDVDSNSGKEVIINISYAADQTEYTDYEKSRISTSSAKDLTSDFETSLLDSELALGTSSETSGVSSLYDLLSGQLNNSLALSLEQFNKPES